MIVAEITVRGLLPAAIAVCVWALLSLPVPAWAQGGDADAGRELAKKWCSGCHVVSPQQQHASNDAVPSFASIARMPSTTAMSVRAFLHTPHPPMPDLQLSHTEVDDLATYILSLRRN